MTLQPRERIILALDVPDHASAVEMVDLFKDHLEVFKVGLELFTSAGPDIVRYIHEAGKKVFLDLKFHDIPNTVKKSALAVAKLGVFMFNVHTLGGQEMMSQAAKALGNYALQNNVARPKLIGVTILTSMDQATMKDELGIGLSLSAQVRHLATMASRSGLDGVVASAEEAEALRSKFGKGFLIVTPGIRPSWAATDDQKRIVTPRKALQMGSDYLVIGRAITAQPDPVMALKRVISELD
ncbi:MAG: orotidine-5'-phosphate decarboxylase [Nitrospira sp.]|nr:orotidine-5'-phosphate decarboxylase [bacterium]MBL7049224.1 orotidine-5'-phosphate decarboxylase [Nitrospira sp.]